MQEDRDVTKDQALEANIYVHSFLANAGEYNKSPHFRPENQQKVRGILERILEMAPEQQNARLVDFGCGTGFIIHLVADLVAEVHGVDITADMMKQVDLSSGTVQLHESTAENTPFEDESFDVATSYSFMDHLFDYRDFLKEAHRVLKQGGVFYSDLNPNRDFLDAIVAADRLQGGPLPLSPFVTREIQGALHNGQLYEEQYGLDSEKLEMAEPGKSIAQGFDASEVLAAARDTGFSKCRVEFEWFLGQAKVMHEQSLEDAATIEAYLNEMLPASSHLFKYLRFIFVK